jgi:hypothetical protein
MRIDELDSNHKEFKKIILNHQLTEDQLDEVLPAILGVARGVGAFARGVGAVARGVGSAVGSVARGVGSIGRGLSSMTRNVGGTTNQATSKMGTNIKNKAKDKLKSATQDTINQLTGNNNDQSNNQSGGGNNNRGTIGTTGTSGTTGTQQTQLQRGQDISIPQPDPKNPNKTVSTNMKVKNVTGREIELEPKKKQPGQPATVKYDKKDLQIQ